MPLSNSPNQKSMVHQIRQARRGPILKNDVTFALTLQAVQILGMNLIFDCES